MIKYLENFLFQTKSNNIHCARTAQILNIRPVPNFLYNTKIYKRRWVYIDEVSQIPNFTNVLKELKTVINKKSEELNLGTIPDYPRILMLGTGCSIPNKVRNTSSILLRINKDCSILLDCGEGTLGQIIRFFGASESLNILRTIKVYYLYFKMITNETYLSNIQLSDKKYKTNLLSFLGCLYITHACRSPFRTHGFAFKKERGHR